MARKRGSIFVAVAALLCVLTSVYSALQKAVWHQPSWLIKTNDLTTADLIGHRRSNVQRPKLA
ncbi:MAG: hypothetical protein J0M26_17405 [Planctomycetes bacterium]|nr:hypothetical protein [Planctomycetota bacterium]